MNTRISVLFFCLVSISLSQTVDWKLSFNRGNAIALYERYTHDLKIDSDLNIFVCNSRANSPLDTAFFYLAKYGGAGNLLWETQSGRNAPQADSRLAAQIAISGGYIYMLCCNNSSFMITKFDKTMGNIVWANTFGYFNTFPRVMCIGNNERIYASAYSQGLIVTCCLDSSGTIQWTESHLPPSVSVPVVIKTDDNGNIYIAVSSASTPDYRLIKYSTDGAEEWYRTYDGGNMDGLRDMEVKNNYIYVTGFSVGTGTGSDFATLKYDSGGNLLWISRYNGDINSNDGANSIAVDREGNAYVAGGSYTLTGYKMAAVKYDRDGTMIWRALSDRIGYAYGIALSSRNVVYITGTDYHSFLTCKINGAGIIQWEALFNTGNGTRILSYPGGCVVSGYCSNTTLGIVKYSDGGFYALPKLTSRQIPEEFALHQNYPNPFNPNTKIKYDIPENFNSSMTNVNISVYDMLGRQAAVLVNDQPVQPGSYEIEFDGTNFSSGVYFYRIDAGSFTDIKKMILVK